MSLQQKGTEPEIKSMRRQPKPKVSTTGKTLRVHPLPLEKGHQQRENSANGEKDVKHTAFPVG
jgi:hypothetical protein